MSIDTIIGIGGFLATIVLGYAGVKYTLKFRKKTEIIFLKNSSISLFKTIVKNLDDIEINFQGKKIGENLILFKGTFFNNGNIDIDKSVVHKPIEIELPEDFDWVRHKIIASSDGLSVTSQVNQNKLVFEFDLLKEGEYFTFDSLVEYNSTSGNDDNRDIAKRLYNQIKISHRITDLKKISKENSIPRPMPIGGLIFMLCFLLGFISVGFYYSFGQYVFPSYKVTSEVVINSTKQFVEIEAKSENEINLNNEKGDKISTIPKDKLPSLLTGNIHTIKESINYWQLCIIGFFSITYFVFLIVIIFSEFRERGLYKKLKDVAEKYDEVDFESRKRIGFTLFEFNMK